MIESVAVLGLGYVGLPLALEFGKRRRTIGFDISERKIESYRQNIDPTGEMSSDHMRAATHLTYTNDPAELAQADVIVVAVPTPVDQAHIPDFSPLIAASVTAGRHMKRGATVVFESTVYPGATEEICIPVLERESGLQWPSDFSVGYSPERVNPGDKVHTLPNIIKVVSGDTPETLERIASLYSEIITAGVYRAPSIRVAEAAKVIENTQRDLNIALMNELAIIFNRLGIDTQEVLEAAGTKWNFLPFRPGLVGGHCIGVDPYYLTHKAEMVGYHPQVILAGRRINDSTPTYVAGQIIKGIIRSGRLVEGARIIILGLAFKENCADLRNSKVAELISELSDFGCTLYVHDALASAEEAEHEYGLTLTEWDDLPSDADATVLAVPHAAYLERPLEDLTSGLRDGGLFADIKSAIDRDALVASGYKVWRL